MTTYQSISYYIMYRNISDYLTDELIKYYYPGEKRLLLNIEYINDKMFEFYTKYLDNVTVKLESKAMKRGERESDGEEESEDDEDKSPKCLFVSDIISLFSLDCISSRLCLNDDDFDLLNQTLTQLVNISIHDHKMKLKITTTTATTASNKTD